MLYVGRDLEVEEFVGGDHADGQALVAEPQGTAFSSASRQPPIGVQ
ncbi:hypothetical protein ABZW03_06180 [Kitasatospora sp. NPDC004799]